MLKKKLKDANNQLDRRKVCIHTIIFILENVFTATFELQLTLSSATPIHLFAKRLGGAMEVNVEAIIGKCFLYLEGIYSL